MPTDTMMRELNTINRETLNRMIAKEITIGNNVAYAIVRDDKPNRINLRVTPKADKGI